MSDEQQIDSGPDTRDHIQRVKDRLNDVITRLVDRAHQHDKSKLGPEEKLLFDKVAGRLKDIQFGSPEYKAALDELKPALDHHYATNSHHPQHYPDGINGMSLLDLIEMVCDWQASGERMKDGSFHRSVEVNKERFGISDQLASILLNTGVELGYIERK